MPTAAENSIPFQEALGKLLGLNRAFDHGTSSDQVARTVRDMET